LELFLYIWVKHDQLFRNGIARVVPLQIKRANVSLTQAQLSPVTPKCTINISFRQISTRRHTF